MADASPDMGIAQKELAKARAVVSKARSNLERAQAAYDRAVVILQIKREKFDNSARVVKMEDYR